MMTITCVELLAESIILYMKIKASEGINLKSIVFVGNILFLTWAILLLKGYQKNLTFMKYIITVGEYLIITRGFMQFKFL